MTPKRSSQAGAPGFWRRHGLWLGPLLVFGGAVSYFMVFVRWPLLRDVPWVNIPLVVAGLLLALWSASRVIVHGPGFWRRMGGLTVAVISLAMAGLFHWYVLDYSYTVPPARAKTVAMEQAPDFALLNAQGRVVQLSDFEGRKVVLVFYRGHW